VIEDVGSLSAATCHEAGHAIAAVLRGLPLIQVSIRSDGRNGCCLTEEPSDVYLRLQDNDEEAIRWAEDKMVMLAAGVEAERALRGSASAIGDGDDRTAIGNLIAALIPPLSATAPLPEQDEHDRVVEERRSSVYSRATALLTPPAVQKALVEVASLLSQKGTASGAEVEAIVRKHVPFAKKVG